jgi:hypothetical protein
MAHAKAQRSGKAASQQGQKGHPIPGWFLSFSGRPLCAFASLREAHLEFMSGVARTILKIGKTEVLRIDGPIKG